MVTVHGTHLYALESINVSWLDQRHISGQSTVEECTCMYKIVEINSTSIGYLGYWSIVK
jgi:hypothetical protein